MSADLNKTAILKIRKFWKYENFENTKILKIRNQVICFPKQGNIDNPQKLTTAKLNITREVVHLLRS
jgi:hypothetical protein